MSLAQCGLYDTYHRLSQTRLELLRGTTGRSKEKILRHKGQDVMHSQAHLKRQYIIDETAPPQTGAVSFFAQRNLSGMWASAK